jgi:hypothetical protein
MLRIYLCRPQIVRNRGAAAVTNTKGKSKVDNPMTDRTAQAQASLDAAGIHDNAQARGAHTR